MKRTFKVNFGFGLVPTAEISAVGTNYPFT
jgi:hypothetical protein